MKMAHGYLRKVGGAEAVDDKFIPYLVDEVRMVELAPTGGKSANDKMRLLRGRVLLKVASAARALRKEKTLLLVAGLMNWSGLLFVRWRQKMN